MLFYKTSGATAEDGAIQYFEWDGTQADAKERRKSLQERGYFNVATENVEVPTDKPSLLAWLNANVTGNE